MARALPARIGIGILVCALATFTGASAYAATKPTTGNHVFRSYSETGGVRDELAAVARRHSDITKLISIGTTHQGRPIMAMKVTRDAATTADGSRPAAVFLGAQHAREWITVQMVDRFLDHLVSVYGTDAAVTRLLNTSEVWVVPVMNPDGYDRTFTPGNRLWRKNARDNDGDGVITGADGVDLNRNAATKFGYDNEGSTTGPSDETYRGPAPNSEPETQALDGLLKRVSPEFLVNYHSAAEQILFGTDWQVDTPTPDDTIYHALVGDRQHPAVPGLDPELTAQQATANGTTNAYASARYGTLAVTVEMDSCQTAADSDPGDEWNAADCPSIFEFPDDETLIEGEFQKNLPFAMAVAQSAAHPDAPVSVTGQVVPDFVVNAFDTSSGADQPVAAVVRRSLTDVRMSYRINGGAEHRSAVREWNGGERYGDQNHRYFANQRGVVRGAKAGDRVEVWFTGKKASTGVVRSDPFTYRVSSDIGGDVLVLAAEDVTGADPTQTGKQARYVSAITSALTADGRTSDVYDLDAHHRQAPDALGVLSHYRAVIWETGDDVVPRAAGQPDGTVARSELDLELAVRDYLNEGGKVLVSGKNALRAEAADGGYVYGAAGGAECASPADPTCQPLVNDFQQYYLGAFRYEDDLGTNSAGQPYPLVGKAAPFEGFTAGLNDPGSAGNQDHTASFVTTSSFLPPAQFPQFASSTAVDWDRPGGAPLDPHSGDFYVVTKSANGAHHRLARTVDLTSAKSADLQFALSYDVLPSWNYVFVEAHEVGTDTWTTLPDRNGHTGTDTGSSCASGWQERGHSFLSHYQGPDCAPRGTTGVWNAATGRSKGWEDWDVDLSAYAGKKVEIAIGYATDLNTPSLGVLLDDTQLTVDGAVRDRTSFETGLDGWQVAPPPPGATSLADDWSRTTKAYDEGPVLLTADSVYLGFGLEGLTSVARRDLLARSLRHLLTS